MTAASDIIEKVSEPTNVEKLKKEVKRGICRIYEELGRNEITRQKDREFFNREISKIYDKLENHNGEL